MYTIALIPCTNQKSDVPGKAREVWKGAHFQLTLVHAEMFYDEVLIMSYKYGLISPDFEIEPYDLNIKDAPIKQKLEWWWMVRDHIAALAARVENKDELLVAIYTGNFERERIIREFYRNGIVHITVPWEGLTIGQRMQIVYDAERPFTKEEFEKGAYRITEESINVNTKTPRPSNKTSDLDPKEIEWVD